MEKVRQDAWSHEDDLLLAETVLRHIREGSTQLRAFEEVGDHLNRTAAACGFRWNAEIRQKYDQAIELAKKQRKERKRALANKISNQNVHQPSYESEAYIQDEQVETESTTQEFSQSNEITIDHIIAFLQDYKKKDSSSRQLQQEHERLKQENSVLLNQNNELTNKLQRIRKRTETIQEDYQSLIQIMDRARQMVQVDDHGVTETPPFSIEEASQDNIEQMAE